MAFRKNKELAREVHAVTKQDERAAERYFFFELFLDAVACCGIAITLLRK